MRNTKQLTRISEGINRRFFEVIADLTATGKINSLSEFCRNFDLYDSRYREMRSTYGITKKPDAKVSRYKTVEPEALYYLCISFSVSAEWLLAGKGEMYKR